MHLQCELAGRMLVALVTRENQLYLDNSVGFVFLFPTGLQLHKVENTLWNVLCYVYGISAM